MISVIGLLLCFIGENLTKKPRLLPTSRLVGTRDGCTEEVSVKHGVETDLVLTFGQAVCPIEEVISGASKFILSCPFLQPLLPWCFQQAHH